MKGHLLLLMVICLLSSINLHLCFYKQKLYALSCAATFSSMQVYCRFHFLVLCFRHIVSTTWCFVTVIFGRGRNLNYLNAAPDLWTSLWNQYFRDHRCRESQFFFAPPWLNWLQHFDKHLRIVLDLHSHCYFHRLLPNFCIFFSIHRQLWLWYCLYWLVSNQNFLPNFEGLYGFNLIQKVGHQQVDGIFIVHWIFYQKPDSYLS